MGRKKKKEGEKKKKKKKIALQHILQPAATQHYVLTNPHSLIPPDHFDLLHTMILPICKLNYPS